jgi:hypothetical protein
MTDDGDFHTIDIMCHKIRVNLEEENRKVMNFINQKDDRTEMLFKHYEMI